MQSARRSLGQSGHHIPSRALKCPIKIHICRQPSTRLPDHSLQRPAQEVRPWRVDVALRLPLSHCPPQRSPVQIPIRRHKHRLHNPPLIQRRADCAHQSSSPGKGRQVSDTYIFDTSYARRFDSAVAERRILRCVGDEGGERGLALVAPLFDLFRDPWDGIRRGYEFLFE